MSQPDLNTVKDLANTCKTYIDTNLKELKAKIDKGQTSHIGTYNFINIQSKKFAPLYEQTMNLVESMKIIPVTETCMTAGKYIMSCTIDPAVNMLAETQQEL